MALNAIIGQAADLGFAVRRNGTILLRTASDSDWQAMLNGLCLVFDADWRIVCNAPQHWIRAEWSRCVATTSQAIDIVPCRGVLVEPDQVFVVDTSDGAQRNG